jgi:DNA-directed RNA polymerase subunit RPC12/RpoP
MKCTRCGTELKNKEVCPRCGGKIASQDVEVEYKDFKISEFLEIRRKQKKAKEGGNGSPVRDAIPGQIKPAGSAKPVPAQDAEK